MSSHQHAAIAAALSSPLRQPHASGSSTLVAGFAETQGQLLSSSPSSAASDASGPESLLASPMSPETASTGAIVDPLRASLTWRDDEITVYDPLDSDDDGEGVNGIGFRPSPALAHQRAMQRRRQLAEYRRREESEARERRRERRNAVGARGGVVPLEMAGLHDQAPGQGGDNGGSGDARAAGGAAGDAETRFLGTSTPRRVRFAEAPDVTEMEPLAAAGL